MDTNIFLTDGIAGLFVVGIISAVLIAYGVHFLISSLSIATGLSLTPDLKEKAAEAKAHSLAKDDKTRERDEEEEHHKSLSMMAVTNAMGVSALITSSIAVFAGSYLGASIIPLTAEYAIVAGLVVWAFFFLSIVLLEYKIVSSVVGGLMHSAVKGVRGTANAASGMLSHPDNAEDQARKSVRAVYEEVDHIIRKDNVDKKLGDYIDKLTPQLPTMDDMEKELKRIIRAVEAEHKTTVSGDDLVEVVELHYRDHPTVNTENAGKLKRAAQNLKRKVDSAGSSDDPAGTAFDALAPVSDEEAAQLRKKLSQILERTNNPELSADEFKQDIMTLFDDPRQGAQNLKARMALFDKPTIKGIVADVSGLDPEKSDKVVEQVFDVFTRMQGEAEKRKADMDRANASSDGGTGASARSADARSMVNRKLADYLNGLERPELNYASLRRDVQAIMEEPGAAPHIVRDRLHKMDRESVVALLSSNSRISEEQAEKAADTMIEARDRALETFTAVENEVTRRYQQGKRKMVIYTEHVRKNAITAAWWLVVGAVVSAATSVGGALLSI